jgi:hypothetical protein
VAAMSRLLGELTNRIMDRIPIAISRPISELENYIGLETHELIMILFGVIFLIKISIKSDDKNNSE